MPRVLESLSTAVDEVVVVDTGSTDATVEIARRSGAKVSHFPWCDDFSAARNESLRQATGDWIFWIDADDELIQSHPGALRELCQRAPQTTIGYWVDVHSAGSETGTEAIVRHWRLFRNDQTTWFRGRVHEEPWPAKPITPEAVASQEDVQIRHWGYVDPAALAGKIARNIQILRSSLAEEPDKALTYYHLGPRTHPARRLPSRARCLRASSCPLERTGSQLAICPLAFFRSKLRSSETCRLCACTNNRGEYATASDFGRAPVR